MNRLLSTALIIAVIAAASQVAAETSEEAEVSRVLHGYEEAWSRHDATAVASFYYEPALRVTPAGPAVRQTRADQEAFFKGFLSALVNRGYARSRWEELNIRELDGRTAVASGVTARYRADGSVFERVAVTYGLYKTNAGWKIFLSTTHAPETVLHFR